MSCYNEKIEWLKESIESILNQTYKNIEFIIVLDNPKRLDIIELVNEYKFNDNRIIFKVNDTNIGLVRSLNKGIEISCGEFIARMDADDISTSDRIEKQINFMYNNNDIDLVGTKIRAIDEKGEVISKRSNLLKDPNKIAKLLPKTNFFNHPTWFAKRKVYITLNGYREISRNEDYDFLLRALSYGFKLSNINEYLLSYRIRNNGISLSNPLEQYIATLYTKRLYEERKKQKKYLDSYKIENCNKFICELCTYNEQKRYNKSIELFNKGIYSFKKYKFFASIRDIIQSIFISKYGFLRLRELIYYKIYMILLSIF